MSLSLADIKVYVANAGALAAYITLPDVLEFLSLANGFFHDTQFIWKALAPISALIYTSIRIRNEKSTKNNRNRTNTE